MGAGSWSEIEDQCLRNEYRKQSLNNGTSSIRWDVIARSLPGRSNRDVRKRWTNVLKNSFNKGPWTAAEDDRLRNAVQNYDTRWVVVAEAVGKRSADQCSKRWHQHLDPALVHTQWNEQEVMLLFRAVAFHGTNWSVIQRLHFPRRPSNSIKNQHAIVSRNNERLQRTLNIISCAPPCCPPATSSAGGSPICTDLPTPSENSDAAVPDTCWSPSMPDVGSVAQGSSCLDFDYSELEGLFQQPPFDTPLPGDTSASHASYATFPTTSFEPGPTGQSREDVPSSSTDNRLGHAPASSTANEVSFFIQDPSESLVSSLVQQLVLARADFRVSRNPIQTHWDGT